MSPSAAPTASAPGTISFSRLNTRPACAPVNASAAPSRAPPHDSGSSWVASPSMRGFLLRYVMPGYPGARAPRVAAGSRCRAPDAEAACGRWGRHRASAPARRPALGSLDVTSRRPAPRQTQHGDSWERVDVPRAYVGVLPAEVRLPDGRPRREVPRPPRCSRSRLRRTGNPIAASRTSSVSSFGPTLR